MMEFGSMHSIGFNKGETIVYRDLDEQGQVVHAKSVIVIEDSDDQIVLWVPVGAPTMKGELLNPSSTGPRRWNEGWHLVETTWWSENLIITKPDQLRSILYDGIKREFYSWYTHIQSRLRRTPLGFDKRDFQLDIVVEPDRQWRWKDEDELELAVELGSLTPEQAEAVRVEGQRAVAELEANAGPYADGWEDWKRG
ncbi:MAG: DUF402 domain-containing protein [Candidatus Latescibacteria bacterium]|nr:DUF402 domain-containing protein [Candidatus Latescibacterota bacterium]